MRRAACPAAAALHGLSLLLAGFARAYHFEKGWAFYSANPFFHLQLGLLLPLSLCAR